jgi:hypothetical protein
MRTKILFKMLLIGVSIFFLPLVTNAQLQIGFHYKIKNDYTYGGPLDLEYAHGDLNTNKKIAPRNNWFGIRLWNNLKADVTPDGGKIKILFWSIIPSSDNFYRGSESYVNSRDSANNFYIPISNRIFLLDGNRYTSIPYAVTEIGVITVPFKYWFGNSSKMTSNNLATDINAGVYVGRKWGRQRFYFDTNKNHMSASFTVAAFAGPTKIDLSATNVKDTTGSKESSELGLSAGIGILYSYRSINIGLFGGADMPASAEGQNWKYANKFWIGFGVGYSLNILGGK